MKKDILKTLAIVIALAAIVAVHPTAFVKVSEAYPVSPSAVEWIEEEFTEEQFRSLPFAHFNIEETEDAQEETYIKEETYIYEEDFDDEEPDHGVSTTSIYEVEFDEDIPGVDYVQVDLNMKKSAMNLLKKPEYSAEAWEEASPDKKKELLAKLLAETQEILGTNMNPEITFGNYGQNYGYFEPEEQVMFINQKFFNNKKFSYKLLITVIHECRHNYQYEAVHGIGNHLVTKEILESWMNNLNNVKCYFTNGKKAYLTQAIEWDARCFTDEQDTLKGYTTNFPGSWESSF